MKTKNNLTTGIIIGICVIVLPLILMSSSTSSNNGIVYGTPESHVWEFHLNDPSGEHGLGVQAFAINKVTGEVRKYETQYSYMKKDDRFGTWSSVTK